MFAGPGLKLNRPGILFRSLRLYSNLLKLLKMSLRTIFDRSPRDYILTMFWGGAPAPTQTPPIYMGDVEGRSAPRKRGALGRRVCTPPEHCKCIASGLLKLTVSVSRPGGYRDKRCKPLRNTAGLNIFRSTLNNCH